ncbi:response regulator transcription factor [Thermoproteota archaeon]
MQKAKKILVIDNEVRTLNELFFKLRADGYKVAIAQNGQAGFKRLQKARFDLIVLNIEMPVMDGFQFYKLLKKKKKYSNLPVLMLSHRIGMKDAFMALGADGFVKKPYRYPELKATIHALVAEKALVLSTYPHTTEVLESALVDNGFESHVVRSRDVARTLDRKLRYKIVMLHLALVRVSPKELMLLVKKSRYVNPIVVVYSDAYVKGTEKGSTVAITELEEKWVLAGVDLFYDARINPVGLAHCIEEEIQRKASRSIEMSLEFREIRK